MSDDSEAQHLAAQQLILEMILTGAPLAGVLCAICRAVERQESGLLCSISLLREAAYPTGLTSCAGLPESFQQDLHAMYLDESRLTPYRLALATGKTTVIDNTSTDERLDSEWRALLKSHGLSSCCSCPVTASDGRVLGSVDVYGRESATAALAGESLSVRTALTLTGIAVERGQMRHSLRTHEERLHQLIGLLPVAVYTIRAPTGEIAYYNEQAAKLWGRRPVSGDSDERWCGSYRLWTPDGRQLPHDQTPMTQALAAGTAFRNLRVILERADSSRVTVLVNIDPIRDASGHVIGAVNVFHDVTAESEAELALSDAEHRLRTAMEVGHVGLWDWNMRSNEIHWSDEHFRMQGYSIGEVTPNYEAWVSRIHPDDRSITEAKLHSAMQTREEYVAEFRTIHPDGTVRWLYGRGRFFYDECGLPRRMAGAMVDITERREAAERQKMLIAELQHRTRNLMAVVKSLSQRTARESPDVASFQARFAERIGALSRVQGLLSRLNGYERVTFDELIQSELAAVIGSLGQVSLAGPRGIRLRSSTLQTFSMALHELATNAVKYGALSEQQGRLSVTWSLPPSEPNADRSLHIGWIESGIVMAQVPTQRDADHGHDFIKNCVMHQLGGEVTFSFTPDGMRCYISIPVSRSTEAPSVVADDGEALTPS